MSYVIISYVYFVFGPTDIIKIGLARSAFNNYNYEEKLDLLLLSRCCNASTWAQHNGDCLFAPSHVNHTYISIKTLGKGLASVNEEITYYKATQMSKTK